MAPRGRIMLVDPGDIRHTVTYMNALRQAGYETVTARGREVVRTLVRAGSSFTAAIIFLPDLLVVRDLLVESDRVEHVVEVDPGVAPGVLLESLVSAPPKSSTTAAAEIPLVSWTRLLTRFDGDTTLIRELADVYRQEVVELFAAMDEAAAASSPSSVAEIAHALRGATSNFEASSILSLISRIEFDAKSRQLTPSRVEIEELKALVNRLLDQLERRLGA